VPVSRARAEVDPSAEARARSAAADADVSIRNARLTRVLEAVKVRGTDVDKDSGRADSARSMEVRTERETSKYGLDSVFQFLRS